MSGIAASIFPLLYSSMNNDDFREQFSKLVNKILPIIILIISVMITCGDEIIRLVVAKEYYSSLSVFRNLAIGLLFSQLYIFTPGLHINKRLTSILIINLVSAAVNLFLCYCLAKIYGINGISVATMLSNIILFLLYFILSQQNYKFDYDYIKISFCMISLLIANIMFTNELAKRLKGKRKI
jgi:O-antigen/teichoic acid export membrane protein